MATQCPVFDSTADFPKPRWFQRALFLVPVGLITFAAILGCTLAQPTFTKPGTGLPPEGMPARLERHVRMLSETLVPRDEGHPENLDRVAAYVKGQFQATGAELSEQVYAVRGKTYRNVIAHFGPATGPLIVVGAHYDSCMERPGADDNASGVAGLIELATLLSRGTTPLGIDLVAFTLEEPPYFRTANMGSAHHAKSLKEAGREVKAMISLEMIGYFTDTPGSQAYPLGLLELFYPSKGNFITVVGDFGNLGLVRDVKKAMVAATKLPVCSMNAPRAIPGIDFSDHLPYWDQGFPAVMVTDTAFNRNHAYHTAQDTADRLDYQRMALVVAGVHQAVMTLSR